MQINVTGKYEEFIADRVARGSYDSPVQVIVEGLRLLGEQEEFRLLKKRLLQNDIQQGLDELDSGKGSPLDIDAIIQRCKAKKAKSKRG
jgi:putative addiction module CopG family antidote